MSESRFLQSLCALLGAAVLVSSVHLFLLVTSVPSRDADQKLVAAETLEPVKQARLARRVTAAETVGETETAPQPITPSNDAEPAIARSIETEPAASVTATASDHVAVAAPAEPTALSAADAHEALSEPVDPDYTASLPPAERAPDVEAAPALSPAKADDPIAALIEKTVDEIGAESPVKLAQAAAPAGVPVLDAPDPLGATTDGKAEVAKLATIAQAKPAPEPLPPLPVRKPKLAPESPAEPAPHLIAEVDTPREIAANANKPNWQPMSLGYANDKPEPQASSARFSAPAPKATMSSGSYRARVWSQLARHRPRLGMGGSATVTFTIGSNGGLRGANVSRSSGNSALDARALAAVRSAAPFPAPPSGLSGSALTYAIQIYFR